MPAKSEKKALLQRIKSDLSLPFWCLAGLFLSYSLFQVSSDFSDHVIIDAIYSLGSWLIISWWLWHDAKQNDFVLPMSYGFLILAAAPFYWPIYIFETRGWMGFVTIGLYGLIFTGVVGLYFLAFMIYA